MLTALPDEGFPTSGATAICLGSCPGHSISPAVTLPGAPGDKPPLSWDPREGNWGPISSIHMRNIQLGFSTSFLTTPNILRKPSNMKRENSNKMNNKSRNSDQKWKIKMTLFFIYKWKIQWSDRKISDMWRTIICRLKGFNIKVIIVMDNLLKTNN